MSLKRFFSHHSHGGHHHSHGENHRSHHSNSNSSSSEAFHRSYSDEHHDVVGNSAAFEADQYRTRRRSSVQFLDRKFIQSLSSQTASSAATDNDFKAAANSAEDVCEL
jgi:hypothetical protein